MGQMPVPEPISSLQNTQIKRLVRLRTRRERDAEGVWLIEGARELSRAHEAGVELQELYVCPDLYSDEAREVVPTLEGRARRLTALTRPVFEKASHRENPDGLLALAVPPPPPPTPPFRPQGGGGGFGVVKNRPLGALLRTADGVGVDAVLVAGEGTDLGNPGVIRASQGSLFTQPVVGLSEAQALEWLRVQRFTLVACTPEADTLYWDAPLTGRVALCLGSEHDGLPLLWRREADLRVSIPMQGQADSLNVSVAGALVLYEAKRQAAQAGGRP